MVPERVDDAPNPPAVLIGYRVNDRRTCRDGSLEDRIWISDNHDHAHGTSAKRFWAVVRVFG